MYADKGTAKIAAGLGVNYAEAVVSVLPDPCIRKTGAHPIYAQVSFEFKNRKAMPVIQGVVTAVEYEALILEVRDNRIL